MSFKKRIPMLFFISTFSVWFISLLLVYLPISPWSEPVFPKSVDAGMLNIFLVATALSFGASLFMGVREPKNWSFLRERIRRPANPKKNIEI
jgi:hypothetical protein